MPATERILASPAPPALLSIGELSERTGVPATTLRYYDELGLVRPTARAAGRRRYAASASRDVGVILFFREIGFSLAEIGRFIAGKRQSQREMIDHKLAELAELDERTLCELEKVTERWLAGACERGFSMSMDSLRTERDAGGVVLLARDGEGRIRGFLHLVPSYGRPAMSLSSMRRDRETPNGLMEFLVVRAIEKLRDRGVEELSLNFAAFARVMHGPRGRFERLAGKLVALGNPYFQIESLYRFNAKFFPRWEPRYLLYEGALGLPRAGLAVMWAEGQLPKLRRRVPVEGES